MLISPLWAELHARRWEWADKAFTEFREQLDPSLRTHFPDGRREVSIVLYGPSQTGKSTLLLRLLGISGGAFVEVQRVLRGGRGFGSSATCTPTRYHWSASADSWEFAIPSGNLITTDGATLQTTLASIRTDVENGTYRATDRPIDIGIPRRYRSKPDSPLWPHVLDLPGTNPRNAAERAHAIRVAERHVATAHVVVLVTQSHKLTPLQPEVLEAEMPPLASWPIAPHRFRVVLTHAVSNGTVRRLVSSHGITTDSLRAHHLAELSSVLRLTPSSELDPASIFPVEYGDSWAALQRDFPALYAESEPVVNSIIEELGRTLTGLDGEQMRLLAALRARPILAAAAQRRADELAQVLDQVKADLERQRAAQARALERVRAAERNRNQRDDELLNARRSARLAATINVDEKPGDDMPTPTSNGSARAYNSECRDRFVRAASEAWRGWARDWATQELIGQGAMAFLNAGLVLLAEATFDSVVNCCGKCDTRWYYFPHWGEPDPDQCAKRHVSRMPEASTALTNQLRDKATERVAEPIARIEERCRTARSELAQRHAASRKRTERVARLEAELIAHDQALDEAARQHQVALSHADALENSLTEHWVARTHELFGNLAAAQDAEQQTLLALGILLAYRTRDALRSPDTDDAPATDGESDD